MTAFPTSGTLDDFAEEVPDVFEEIVGWRAWNARLAHELQHEYAFAPPPRVAGWVGEHNLPLEPPRYELVPRLREVGWLYSPFVTLLSSTGMLDWPGDRWLQAVCLVVGHAAPARGCCCGIYAARDLEHLIRLGYHDAEPPRFGVRVIGQVGLSGKVIVGEKGWRAQRARVIRLYVPHYAWQLVRPLARAYRVDVVLSNTLELQRIVAA